jgi:hypothetical protein
MAASQPVAIASNQNTLNVNSTPPILLNQPTSNVMSGAGQTIVYQVEGGNSFYLTLTNAPAVTAAWVGTVSFQWSSDNTNWNALTVTPVTVPGAGAAAVTSATANGLWLAELPNSANMFIRANMTAFTSGSVYFFVQPYGVANARLTLPWTYTVTSGQTLVGPIDASGFSELDIQISAVTTTVLTVQGTNDPSVTTWINLPVINATTAAASAATITAAGNFRAQTAGFKWVRVQVTTTGTVLTVQGVSTVVGQSLLLTSIGNDVGVTVNSGTVTTVSAVTAVNANATTYTNADIASAAITTTTTGATVTVANGTAVAFNVAITLVSGTTPTYDFEVQETGDGTNWSTIYMHPRQTATGFFITPAIRLNHNRYRIVETISGTTPSFTRAVTSSRTAGDGLYHRSRIDRTINPATTNSTSAVLFCTGATSYSMIVNQGAGGSAVTFALDGSDDNTNWVQGLATVNGVVGGATPVVCYYTGGSFKFLRARVVTGVASATISYVTLVAEGMGAATPMVKQAGKVLANAPIRNDYTTTNVTTGAYVQLSAALTATCTEIEIFDSSGQTLQLATGAAASEVPFLNIFPGGNGRVPAYVPAGSRLAVRAVSGTASVGELDINFYA